MEYTNVGLTALLRGGLTLKVRQGQADKPRGGPRMLLHGSSGGMLSKKVIDPIGAKDRRFPKLLFMRMAFPIFCTLRRLSKHCVLWFNTGRGRTHCA